MNSKTNRMGLTADDISKLKAMRHCDDAEINGASWCKLSDEEEFHVFVIGSTDVGRIVKFSRAYDEPSA